MTNFRIKSTYHLLNMVQFEIEVKLLHLFIFESTRAILLPCLIYNPSEFVPFMKLSDFNVIRKTLASRHKVSIIFLVTLIAFLIRIFLWVCKLADKSELHFDILLENLTFFAHLESIDCNTICSSANLFEFVWFLALDYGLVAPCRLWGICSHYFNNYKIYLKEIWINKIDTSL